MTTTSGSIAGYPIPMDDFDRRWTEKQKKEMEKVVRSLLPDDRVSGEERESFVGDPEVSFLNEMCLG